MNQTPLMDPTCSANQLSCLKSRDVQQPIRLQIQVRGSTDRSPRLIDTCYLATQFTHHAALQPGILQVHSSTSLSVPLRLSVVSLEVHSSIDHFQWSSYSFPFYFVGVFSKALSEILSNCWYRLFKNFR